MQVRGVRFRSFLFYFIFLVFFFSIHVIDLYEILEMCQKSCPMKSLLHMIYIYILVCLRIKRKQVKNLSQEALKVVIIYVFSSA